MLRLNGLRQGNFVASRASLRLLHFAVFVASFKNGSIRLVTSTSGIDLKIASDMIFFLTTLTSTFSALLAAAGFFVLVCWSSPLPFKVAFKTGWHLRQRQSLFSSLA